MPNINARIARIPAYADKKEQPEETSKVKESWAKKKSGIIIPKG